MSWSQGIWMSKNKRFQKIKIVDQWGGIYDSETDRVLNVNDVEHKLNVQQATIKRLQEKVADYEIILAITNDERTLCEEQQIDDVAFYCSRYSDYRCYPLCTDAKDCFKADGTFQEKLKDLKEFWGERWYK